MGARRAVRTVRIQHERDQVGADAVGIGDDQHGQRVGAHQRVQDFGAFFGKGVR